MVLGVKFELIKVLLLLSKNDKLFINLVMVNHGLNKKIEFIKKDNKNTIDKKWISNDGYEKKRWRSEQIKLVTPIDIKAIRDPNI